MKSDKNRNDRPQIQRREKRVCPRCGLFTSHSPLNCIARDQVCRQCNKKGHFAQVCRTKMIGAVLLKKVTGGVGIDTCASTSKIREKKFLVEINETVPDPKMADSTTTRPIAVGKAIFMFNDHEGGNIQVKLPVQVIPIARTDLLSVKYPCNHGFNLMINERPDFFSILPSLT